MLELKPCPFCGSENVKDLHKWQGPNHSAYIKCERCNARTGFYTGERRESYRILVGEAAEAWNRRDGKEADIAPVVHGRWDISKGPLGDMCKCSACGSLPSLPTKFCPYCGARMDGATE